MDLFQVYRGQHSHGSSTMLIMPKVDTERVIQGSVHKALKGYA